MGASAADIAAVRRMTGASDTEYPDGVLGSIIERYPVVDADGHFPEDEDWTARYDLNAAAADVWAEKAAVLAAGYDFNADGADYKRSQAYEQAMKQARYFRSRRMIGTVKMTAYPVIQDEQDDD